MLENLYNKRFNSQGASFDAHCRMIEAQGTRWSQDCGKNERKLATMQAYGVTGESSPVTVAW